MGADAGGRMAGSCTCDLFFILIGMAVATAFADVNVLSSGDDGDMPAGEPTDEGKI